MSEEDGVFLKVRKIVADKLDYPEEEVLPTSDFSDDLHADSLDLVELIMAFEHEFDIEVSDEEAEKIKTVKDAVDYVKDHALSNYLTTAGPIPNA